MKDDKKAKNGITGDVYGISILPNTATELAEAIYNQKDLSKEDAMDMAGYLDKRYGMSGFVPTSFMTKDDSELDDLIFNLVLVGLPKDCALVGDMLISPPRDKVLEENRHKDFSKAEHALKAHLEAEKLKARKEELKKIQHTKWSDIAYDIGGYLKNRLAELEGKI